MANNLLKSLSKTIHDGVREEGRWVFSEPGIVTDNKDPEERHRIKVTISSIDENEQFDDWISPATPFSFGDGFGSVFLPEIGSEVMVSGRKGEKYNFVYHGAVYNEDVHVPELGDDTQGMKVPKNLSFIATLLFLLQGQNLRAIAEQLLHAEGQNVEVVASELATVHGQNTTIEADQATAVMGNTVTIHADGSMTIQANGNISISSIGNVSVNATGNLTLQNRLVNKAGGAI